MNHKNEEYQVTIWESNWLYERKPGEWRRNWDWLEEVKAEIPNAYIKSSDKGKKRAVFRPLKDVGLRKE